MPSTLLKNGVILSELSGLTWDKFFDHVDQCGSNELHNDALSISPVASSMSTWSTPGVSTLPYKKAACYGFCPTDETESLKVVKCKFCGLIVKVVGYGHHMRLRHQYRPSKNSSASSSGDDCQDFLLSPPHLSMIVSTSIGSQNPEGQESVNCNRICSPPYYVEQCKDMALASPKGVSPKTFAQSHTPSKRKKSTRRKDPAKLLSNKRANVNVKVAEFSTDGDGLNLRGKEKSHKVNGGVSNTAGLLSHNVQAFSTDVYDVESRKKMLKKLESANILDNSQTLSKSNKGHSSYSFPLSPSSASNYSPSSALSDEANATPDMTHVDVHAFKPSLDVGTSCVRRFLKDRDNGASEPNKSHMHNGKVDNCSSDSQKDDLSLRDFGERKVLPFFRREPATRNNHYMLWLNNMTYLESSGFRLKKAENLMVDKAQPLSTNLSSNTKSNDIVKEEVPNKRFTVQDSTNFVNSSANTLPTHGIDVSYSTSDKDLDLDLSSAFNCDDAALMGGAEGGTKSVELSDTDAQKIAHIAASLRESSNNYLAAQQKQNFASTKQRAPAGCHNYQIIPQQGVRNCTTTDNIDSALVKAQRHVCTSDGKANEQELQGDIWNGHLNGSRQFLSCSPSHPSHAEQQSYLVVGETPEQRHQRTMMFRAAQATGGSALLRRKNVNNVASTSTSAMFPAIKKRLYHETNGSDDYKQLIGQQQEAGSSSLSPTEKSLVKKFRPIVPRQHPPNVGTHAQFVNPQAKEAAGYSCHKNVYVAGNSIGFGGRQKLLRMPNYKPIAQKRSTACSTMIRNMPTISTMQSRFYNQNGGLAMQGTILTSSDVNNVNMSLGNGYDSNSASIGAPISRPNMPRFLPVGTSRVLMPTTSSQHFTNSVCQSQRVAMGDDEKKIQFSAVSHRNVADGHMLVMGSSNVDDNGVEGKNGLQPYQYGIEPPPVLEAEGRLSTNPMMGSSTNRHRTSAGVNYFADETSSGVQHSAQPKHGQFLPHPGIPHQFHQRFPPSSSSSSQYRPQHYPLAQKDAETKQYFLAPPTSVGLPQ